MEAAGLGTRGVVTCDHATDDIRAINRTGENLIEISLSIV